MRGRGWPLEVILELALRRAAGARAVLGTTLAAEARLRDERDLAAAEVGAARAVVASAGVDPPEPGATAASLLARARHQARLRDEAGRLAVALARREAALASASAETAARRDVLVGARAAVRTLEAHRDAWREARARSRERAEDAAAEELVNARRGAGS